MTDPFPYGPELFGKTWESLRSRIDVRGPDDCWPWTGKLNRYGYGELNGWVEGKSKTFGGHRVALEASTGDVLGSLHALHRCETRRCCNPKHLRSGTNAENVVDREEFGRSSVGEGNGRAVLNEAGIYDMLTIMLKDNSPPITHVAEVYGISRRQAFSIREGERWVEVFRLWLDFHDLIGPPGDFRNPLYPA